MEEASTEDSANQLYRETRLLEVGPHMCMYGMAVDGWGGDQAAWRPLAEADLAAACAGARHVSSNFCSVQSLSRVQLFVSPWTAARQASLSITNSRIWFKPMSTESVMPSNHLILCRSFSCLQTFPSSGSFPMSQFFTSGAQSIGASALVSVLSVNIQG